MMSTAIRFILVNSNDEVLRLPLARSERLFSRSRPEALPEFAGQRVRAAEAVVELKNRKPVRVLRVTFHYLRFDEEGHVDHERYMKDGATVMEAGGFPDIDPEAPDPKVVEAGQRFAVRRRDHDVWWRPSSRLEDAILQAALDDARYRRL